jgi:hypothetical protein
MSASRARAAVSEDLEETRRLNEYEFGSDGRLPESIPLEQGFRAWRLHATSLILAIADLVDVDLESSEEETLWKRVPLQPRVRRVGRWRADYSRAIDWPLSRHT